MVEPAAGVDGAPPDSPRRRLDSWKEIAAYLGRDVRTVQRWERRDGLPVHRLHHSRLGSVFAYAAELDAWRHGRDPGAGDRRPGTRSVPPVSARRRWALVAMTAAAVGLVVGFALALAGRSAEIADAASRIRSVAVLPLADLSSDSKQTYFVDGMTEALIARLSGLRGVRVISRTSVMPLKAEERPLREIADLLSVDAVIEGSVLRSDGRVRISARLILADTQESVWSGSYDRELEDVLTLQREVAEGIAREIRAMMAGAPGSAGPASIAPEAYDAYLRARFFLNRQPRTSSDVREAVGLFEQTIAREPGFAPAHAGLGTAYQDLGGTTTGVLPVVETLQKSTVAARRALELDPRLGEAHRILAHSKGQVWDWTEAEAEYRRALDVDPNDADAHVGLGALLIQQGRADEGVAMARQGRDLDPLSPGTTVRLGWLLYQARRPEEAIRELQTVLAAEPDRATALWFLGFALLEVSRFDESIQVLERAAAVWNRSTGSLGVLARAYGRAGRRTEALQIVHELAQREQAGYVPPAALVNAYVGIGDLDRAFASLERACREHANIVQFLKTHPLYDPMRDDPRFTELLRRAGLS